MILATSPRVRLEVNPQVGENEVPYKFRPDESVPEAAARVAAEQLEGAEHQLIEGVNHDPVEAVHSARKALKKERSLLRLARDPIRGSERRHANVALRDVGRRLSGTRDAEVLVQALDDLHERYAGQVPMAVFSAFRAQLDDERAAARARLADPMLARETVVELAGLRERIERWRLRTGGWDAVGGGLRRSYGRGRKAFRQARSEPNDENLHEWRKRSKDTWYHLRLIAPVCGEAIRGQAKDAHALADLLGDDHDLAVLRERLVAHGHEVATDVEALLGLVDHRRGQLQSAAMLAGERVYAERPKEFTRRIHRCWHAGRTQAKAARASDPAELAEASRAVGVA
jgi:CHAD domain-containing protein